MHKIMEVEKALSVIKDGDTVAVGGMGGNGVPEELLLAVEKRFLDTGHPANLILYAPGAPGDARGKGLDHFAHKGFIKKIISTYIGPLAPRLAQMMAREEIESYIFPLGALVQLYRELGAGRPGLITHVGLGTFVDPRIEGPGQNSISKDNLIEVIQLQGKDWLFYKEIPIQVALLRGTTADEQGNVSMEKEIGFFDMLQAAQAVRRYRGKVIVQVERVTTAKTLKPKEVKIPGVMVDAVVIARPENHMQTLKVQYNPAYSGEIRIPTATLASHVSDYGRMGHVSRAQKAEFTLSRIDTRRIIGKRASLEMFPEAVVNLGVGAPELVSDVVMREGISNRIHFTIEHGPIGGIPAYGLNFGAALNPDVIMEVPALLDFYNGGGIDIACLGLIEADQWGNVNASKFGESRTAGGFIDISQNAKKVIFCTTFTQGAEINIEAGKVRVLKDGSPKFVSAARQITFNGKNASDKGQPVLFVTERAVFKLGSEGLVLVEIAPGISLEQDVLQKMGFRPIISPDLKEMPAVIFSDSPVVGLKEAFDLNCKGN